MTVPSKPKELVRLFLPRGIRKHRIWAGHLRGAAIYTSWHDYPGAILGRTEKALLRWFQREVSAGETWIDVGAHYGYTAIALARLVGPGGRVLAFEPVLGSAGCIGRSRQANALPQLQVVPLGLSACPRLELIRLPAFRGMADSTLGRTAWQETIMVAAFDSVWWSLSAGASRIHGIKIDVQGMELDVIRGMRESLKRWRPKLVVEFHSRVDRRAVLDCLAECGYDPAVETVDSKDGASAAAFRDDRSYAFHAR